MLYFGIFNTNDNYKLIRYSDIEQTSRQYLETDPVTKQSFQVNEICLPNIEYSTDHIGKHYDPNTNTFVD